MADIIEELMKFIPDKSKISDTYFEGANIVLYTKDKDFFLDNNGVIKQIVDAIKKRVELRPDPAICMDIEKAETIIREIIPKDAGEINLLFDIQRALVTIEVEKPGVAIGKQGEVLKEIRRKSLWVPIIRRTPPIRSKIIENINHVLFENNDYRKKFLNNVGKRIYGGWTKGRVDEWIRVSFLGAGRQVGRSCFLLQTPESKILMDCGINVSAQTNEEMFPLLEAPEFKIDELDAVIISHSHIDHVGFLPYLYKMGFTGPTYMTAPTRDIAALLCLDLINIAQKEANKAIYSSTDIKEMVKHAICLDYGEVTDITPDVRLTFYDAGHKLGSALCHLHIGNGLHNFVYSLDGSTKIPLIDINNNVEFVEIGKFTDNLFKDPGFVVDNGFVQEKPNLEKYSTIAFNPKTLKSELVDITSFVRHPINEELFKIKTESGRSLTATKSHSLFTAKNGKILPVKTSELNVGDFIAGPKRIPSLNVGEPIIDLMPYFGDLRISVEDNEFIDKLISDQEKHFVKLKDSDKEIVKKILLDYYNGMYKEEIAKKHKVHPRRIRRILTALNLKNQPRVKEAFQDKIRITRDFARFLGYYISEGSPAKNTQTVSIANDNNEILEDCYKIVKKELNINGDLRYQDHCIIFSSKQLKYLLSKVLKCGTNAYEKRIPKELLFTNKDIISDLLYGLFSGDGGIRNREKGREINYGSKSKGLIDDIMYLLLQFNLVPTLEFNKTSEMNNLHIYNSEKIRHFLEEININNGQRDELIDSLNKRKMSKASFDMRIPLSALSDKAHESKIVKSWNKVNSFGASKLCFEELAEEDLSLIYSDLFFDKIKTIERIESSGQYVYDLRIDGYENFIAGDGFLFAHNTGDYLYESSNLLNAAETRFPRLETIMMEATYGSKKDTPPTRRECELFFTDIIKKTLERGGKVLVPVLGSGRAQEIMVILDKLVREGTLQKIPVYVQGLVWDITAIHTAYPEFFNSRVKKLIYHKDENPFLNEMFKRVGSRKEMLDVVEEKGPCVILATSGMLTGGASLEYFKMLGDNPKNSIVMTCYQGPGSIGRRLEE
ncbi:MAG: LAGLIDADG family homing endonuclease, partial [Nanoarchaeota archaeon]